VLFFEKTQHFVLSADKDTETMKNISPATIGVGSPSRVVAVSRDRDGMRQFFREQGLTYLERPKFYNGRTERAAKLLAKRYKKLNLVIDHESGYYWRQIEELKSARRNAQAFMASGAMADMCVCSLDPTIGCGLFARMAIPGGMFVGAYSGVVVESADFDDNSSYAFESNPWHEFFRSRFPKPHPRLFVDAQDAGNELRFINHIDKNRLVRSPFMDDEGKLVGAANVAVSSFFLKGAFLTVVAAARDIGAGEELRFDYGDDYWSVRGVQPDCSTVYRIIDGRLAEVPTKRSSSHR